MRSNKKIPLLKRIWHVISWILLIALFLNMDSIDSWLSAVFVFVEPYGFIGNIGVLVGIPIIAGLILIGIFDSLPRIPCSECGGSGYVQASGAWTTGYDSERCSNCHGSGNEPVDLSSRPGW